MNADEGQMQAPTLDLSEDHIASQGPLPAFHSQYMLESLRVIVVIMMGISLGSGITCAILQCSVSLQRKMIPPMAEKVKSSVLEDGPHLPLSQHAHYPDLQKCREAPQLR